MNVNKCFSAVGVARVTQIFSKQKDGKPVKYVVSFLWRVKKAPWSDWSVYKRGKKGDKGVLGMGTVEQKARSM